MGPRPLWAPYGPIWAGPIIWPYGAGPMWGQAHMGRVHMGRAHMGPGPYGPGPGPGPGDGDGDDGGGGDGGTLPASPTPQPTCAGRKYPVKVTPHSDKLRRSNTLCS